MHKICPANPDFLLPLGRYSGIFAGQDLDAVQVTAVEVLDDVGLLLVAVLVAVVAVVADYYFVAVLQANCMYLARQNSFEGNKAFGLGY